MKPNTSAAVVVNDDPVQLSILSGLVAKAGLEPLSFTGAEAALEAMDPGALPALIVTDLYMPGIDGWRFCRLLRSAEYADFNQVPILVVSSTFAGDEPARIAGDLGVEAFLASPVDGRVFVEQVHAILRGEQKRIPVRVLIVEDSKTLARILKKTFEDSGYQADVALSVHEAMNAFFENDYNVAVMDYHLPDGTGDLLLERFRRQRPDCVFLMMTSDPSPKLSLDWMKRGAAAYLRKPFAPAYLLELCERARRERALLRAEDLLELRTRELRESAARLNAIFDAFPGVLNAIDREYNIIGVSRRLVERIGGSSPEDVVGRKCYQVWKKRNNVCPECQVQHVLVDGQPRIKNCTPEEVKLHGMYFDAYIAPIQDEEGNVTGAVEILLDISKRLRVEEALRESEEKYRSILDRSFEMITLHDLEGRFLEVNKEAEKQTGYSKEELLGMTVFDLHPDPSNREYKLSQWQAWPVGQPVTLETVHRRKDGSHLPVEVTTGKVFFGGKEYMLALTRDLTERKRAEEERTRLQTQLTQAQKLESVGRLAGGVAHDFNNLLSVMLGHAELAMDQLEAAHPVHARLKQIRDTGRRSTDIVRQLLAFARKQAVAPRVLDLNDTVAGMLKMLRRLIGEDITLAWMPGSRLWPVKMDPSQIDQILANLCVNARDAIAEVGTITIRTENFLVEDSHGARQSPLPAGAYVLLTVSDNGSGMDREVLKNIFEPFFTTKDVGKGTGLGLATVYGIVKQNNGSIDVYSEPGLGTTFRIYLPRYETSLSTRPQKEKVEPLPTGTETILLVEDEPVLLAMARDMLERLGYRVLAAGHPEEALAQTEEHPEEIHAIMTDVVMPFMSGRDLTLRLKALRPKIRTLFMSGYTADVISRQGVLDPGVHFIQKPFSLYDLAMKIRSVLEDKDMV